MHYVKQLTFYVRENQHSRVCCVYSDVKSVTSITPSDKVVHWCNVFSLTYSLAALVFFPRCVYAHKSLIARHVCEAEKSGGAN